MAILELRPVFASYVAVGLNTGDTSWQQCLRPESYQWEPTPTGAAGQASTGTFRRESGGGSNPLMRQFQCQFHYDVSAITPFRGPIKYTRTMEVSTTDPIDSSLAFCFGLQNPVVDVRAYWPEVLRDSRTIFTTPDWGYQQPGRYTAEIAETSWEGDYLGCADVHNTIISEVVVSWTGAAVIQGPRALSEVESPGDWTDPVLTVDEDDNLLAVKSNILFGSFPI